MIRILMALSLLLLLCFMAYWLNEVRSAEKERLTKELTADLEKTHSRLTDSTIKFKLVMPILEEMAGQDKQRLQTVIRLHDSVKQNITVRHRANNVIVGKDTLIEKKRFEFRSVRPDTMFAQGDIVVERQEIPEEVYTRGVRLMLEAPDSPGNGLDYNTFEVDTATLARHFRRDLYKAGKAFSIGFVPIAQRLPGEGIYLGGPAVLPKYLMRVQGYDAYLVRKLLVPGGIALILLLVTGIAFYLSYKSLRAQTRLATIRNDFISNMSHELKTPVSTVKVALEAISDPAVLDDTATAREYIRMATLETARLELLINQSLQTALLEEGRIEMQTEPVNMQTLVQTLCATLAPRFAAAGALIDIRIAPGDYVLQADRLQIQGVIINILDNALKYAGPNPDIALQLASDVDRVQLRIADKGPGIPAPYRSRIFDKFFRVPRGNEHSVKGYGLGLSYAAQVMRRHHGSIAVEETPGGGCTFVLHFKKSAA